MAMPQPGSPQPDHYRLLGVGPEASRADIAHAYRQRARAAHPDSRPQDADAPARFRALTEAYQVLSDPARRAAYDQSLRPRPGLDPGTPSEAGPRAQPPLRWSAGPSKVPAPAQVPGPPLWAGPVRIDPPAPGPAQGAPREGHAQVGERDLLALLAELADRYLDDGWYRGW